MYIFLIISYGQMGIPYYVIVLARRSGVYPRPIKRVENPAPTRHFLRCRQRDFYPQGGNLFEIRHSVFYAENWTE